VLIADAAAKTELNLILFAPNLTTLFCFVQMNTKVKVKAISTQLTSREYSLDDAGKKKGWMVDFVVSIK
jgi:hypothetical protein